MDAAGVDGHGDAGPDRRQRLAGARGSHRVIAEAGSAIECPSPLNVPKETYSCTIIVVIEHVQMNIST